MGTTGATARSDALRASMITTSASSEPTSSAAGRPAISASLGMLRWARRTSISTLVPAASPSRRRAVVQNSSWVSVKAPLARARARAVAPGKAPGLSLNTSR